MKHLFLIIVTVLLIFATCHAQVVGPDKMTGVSAGIQEKLVGLAIQNPQLEVADHEVKIAKYNLSAAKGWWAENFSFSFNANEYSLKAIGKSADNTGRYYTLYPLYNMGINIPIGGIFSKPQAVKAARERVAIAENQRAIQYTAIKSAVLTAYQNYLSNRELYTVQSQLTESAYSDYLQTKQKFRNGEISVDDYNGSVDRYQNALRARISSENTFRLSQIQLEALIGVPLDNVLSNIESSSNLSSDTTHVEGK